MQTLKGDLTNLRISGAHHSWAHAGFPPMSRVLPLFHCSLGFHKWGGTIELIGVGLGAMGSTDFTKLLFLLSIAQRLEWRGQTHKDGGSNPSEVEILNLIAENKPDQHSVDRPPPDLLPTAPVPLL